MRSKMRSRRGGGIGPTASAEPVRRYGVRLRLLDDAALRDWADNHGRFCVETGTVAGPLMTPGTASGEGAGLHTDPEAPVIPTTTELRRESPQTPRNRGNAVCRRLAPQSDRPPPPGGLG